MPGPAPKDPALRQRRNKATTRATLPSEEEAFEREVPELPKLIRAKWHPQVLAWWRDVNRSPMAAEYLEADRQRLYRCAVLHQDFWKTKDSAARLRIAAEIRQQEAPLGITPMDRRRLQWEVERGEQAADRTEERRERKRLTEASKQDPRKNVKIVS